MKPCFQLKRGRAGRNERLVGGEGGSRGRSEGETERLGEREWEGWKEVLKQKKVI